MQKLRRFPSSQDVYLVQLLHPLEVRQLMRNTEIFLQLLVRVVFGWIDDKIQDDVKALLWQGIDNVVEHVLLVIQPLEAKPGLGDGELGLSVLYPERRKAERGCMLSIVMGYQCKDSVKIFF
jgi:hypothetical protein